MAADDNGSLSQQQDEPQSYTFVEVDEVQDNGLEAAKQSVEGNHVEVRSNAKAVAGIPAVRVAAQHRQTWLSSSHASSHASIDDPSAASPVRIKTEPTDGANENNNNPRTPTAQEMPSASSSSIPRSPRPIKTTPQSPTEISVAETSHTQPAELNPSTTTTTTTIVAPSRIQIEPESQDSSTQSAVTIHTQPNNVSRTTIVAPSRIQMEIDSQSHSSFQVTIHTQPQESNALRTTISTPSRIQMEIKSQNNSPLLVTIHNPTETSTPSSVPVPVKTEPDLRNSGEESPARARRCSDAGSFASRRNTAVASSSQQPTSTPRTRKVYIPPDSDSEMSSSSSRSTNRSTRESQKPCSPVDKNAHSEKCTESGKASLKASSQESDVIIAKDGNQGSLLDSSAKDKSAYAFGSSNSQPSPRTSRQQHSSTHKKPPSEKLSCENGKKLNNGPAVLESDNEVVQNVSQGNETEAADSGSLAAAASPNIQSSRSKPQHSPRQEKSPFANRCGNGANSNVGMAFQKNEVVFVKYGHQGNIHDAVILEDVPEVGDHSRTVLVQWGTLKRRERVPLLNLIKMSGQRSQNVTDRLTASMPIPHQSTKHSNRQPALQVRDFRVTGELAAPPTGCQTKNSVVSASASPKRNRTTSPLPIPINGKSLPNNSLDSVSTPQRKLNRRAFRKNDVVVVADESRGTEYVAVVLDDVPEDSTATICVSVRCVKRRIRKLVPISHLSLFSNDPSELPVCDETEDSDDNYTRTPRKNDQSGGCGTPLSIQTTPPSVGSSRARRPTSPHDLWDSCSDDAASSGVFTNFETPKSIPTMPSSVTVGSSVQDHRAPAPHDSEDSDSEGECRAKKKVSDNGTPQSFQTAPSRRLPDQSAAMPLNSEETKSHSADCHAQDRLRAHATKYDSHNRVAGNKDLAFHKNEVVFAKDGMKGMEYNATVLEDVPAGCENDDSRTVCIRWGTLKKDWVPIGHLTKVTSRPTKRTRHAIERWHGPEPSSVKGSTRKGRKGHKAAKRARASRTDARSLFKQESNNVNGDDHDNLNVPPDGDSSKSSIPPLGLARSQRRVWYKTSPSADPSTSSDDDSVISYYSDTDNRPRTKPIARSTLPFGHGLGGDLKEEQDAACSSRSVEPTDANHTVSFSKKERVFVKDGIQGMLYNAVVLEDVPAVEASSQQQQQQRCVWIRWGKSKREQVPVDHVVKLLPADGRRPKRQRQSTDRWTPPTANNNVPCSPLTKLEQN